MEGLKLEGYKGAFGEMPQVVCNEYFGAAGEGRGYHVAVAQVWQFDEIHVGQEVFFWHYRLRKMLTHKQGPPFDVFFLEIRPLF